MRQGMARHRKYRPGCGRERGRAASPAHPRCRPVSPVPSRVPGAIPCPALLSVPPGCALRPRGALPAAVGVLVLWTLSLSPPA